MAKRGVRYLAKGGDAGGPEIEDRLVQPGCDDIVWRSPRIDTRHTHGTGCTLASACAAGLAQGLSLTEAVARAWAYVQEAIARAPGLGRGHGPLDHGWPLRQGRTP
jgi:hydroxymethylpyrimidine/phosphomethylpyrimidine kinase